MFYWPRSFHRFSSVKLAFEQAPRGGGRWVGGEEVLLAARLLLLTHTCPSFPPGGGGVGEWGEKEGLLAADFFSRLTPVLR